MSTATARTHAGEEIHAAADDPTIVFPNGLVGCDGWKRFVLMVDDTVEAPVATLQSLDDAEIALLVTDPTVAVPGYRVPVTREDRAELGLPDGTAPVVYATLSIGADGWGTANLLGPLVINPITRRGKQLVLTDSTYGTRHPIVQLNAVGDDACSS